MPKAKAPKKVTVSPVEPPKPKPTKAASFAEGKASQSTTERVHPKTGRTQVRINLWVDKEVMRRVRDVAFERHADLQDVITEHLSTL